MKIFKRKPIVGRVYPQFRGEKHIGYTKIVRFENGTFYGGVNRETLEHALNDEVNTRYPWSINSDTGEFSFGGQWLDLNKPYPPVNTISKYEI